MNTVAKTTTLAAASVGATDSVTSSHICLGSVAVRPPPTKIAIVNSSKEWMKAANRPPLMAGTVIRRSTCQRPAPRAVAARSSDQS